MKFQVIHPHELTVAMIGRWLEIQESDSALASPYFCPEFTLSVAAVRSDVQIGILKDKNQIIGFFPFHRRRCGVARPIGLGLSDYHGLIVDARARWTVETLLEGCRLVRWEFDHLIASQWPFANFVSSSYQSPIIDVSQGFDRYKAGIDRSARKQLREVERKRAKLESAIGPINFIQHTQDQSVLRQMIAWKSFQCKQTGTVDYFSLNWCARLIKLIHASRHKTFGGMLSCLYAGNQLAAVHYSMYSRNVWHSWFPAYDENLKQYSPGLILLYELIKSAADSGIHYIDLGKGKSLYKKRVMTGCIQVAEGCAEIPSLFTNLYRIRKKIELWSRESIFKAAFYLPGRIIKEMERKSRYK